MIIVPKLPGSQRLRGTLDRHQGRQGITVEIQQTTYFFRDYSTHFFVAAILQRAGYGWRAAATAQAVVRDQN
ncbi:MAG: hypothetical protein WC028_16745 [Candidatus Obscuribacterales bacterium]